MTLYFHCWRYLVKGVIISWHYIFTADDIWWRGWLYRDIIFSLLTIFGEGGDYIVTLYFPSWQYLVRGWLYRDKFSLLTIFGEGVMISWHNIISSSQYLVRGWLYRDITFSLLTIFGEGGIISWHYIFTPDNIWWGGWLYRHHISLSKFDSTMIPGFYHYSYTYIHPIGELKWLYLSMIPSLLLKLSVSDGYVDGLYQQSMMNKDL